MLIQQHGQKEEGVLYPMAEEHLAPQWAELRARLESLEG
jgi:hemerythrin-like domain-containing protein